MAKIEVVEYEALPGIAGTIQTTADKLYEELNNAYKEVENMRSNWYGKRYNALVTQFNGLTAELNEMLKLTMHDIPETLRIVANNYAMADGAESIPTSTDEAKRITDIVSSSEVGMKFLTENVETSKTNVSNKFVNAKAYMNQIYQDFKGANWKSEAATAFDSKLSSLNQSISTQLEELNTSFGNLMAQTLSDMASTESANTVQ